MRSLLRATGALVREAAATARSQTVASVLTVLMVAGMILAVMFTTGRTVANEQQVLGSIDSAGTRSIVVRAQGDAHLTTAVLARLAAVDGIDWMGAFSSAQDATNAQVLDGTRVPMRYAYGAQFGDLGIPASPPLPGQQAYASDWALSLYGLPDGAGAITVRDGPTFAMSGRLTVPANLSDFEPLVLVPTPVTGAETVNLLIITVTRPDLVAPVSRTVQGLLAVDDPSKATIATSENLATLRALVQGQLSTFSRGLVLALLGLTAVLIAVLLYGLVLMRRKDYGRRRALGASRGLIVGLLLTQTLLLAVTGVLVGVATSYAVMFALRLPPPGAAFTVALGVLTVAVAVLAAWVPAVVASRREPIRELRTP